MSQLGERHGGSRLILNFHGIGDVPAGIDPSEAAYWWDQEAFNDVLDLVQWTVSEDLSPITITFDDGNISDARIALPELVKRDLTACFFVCAGRIGRTNYVDRRAVGELLAAGMRVGSHGMNHVDWRRTSADGLDVETAQARRMLEDICGHRIDEVAVPFGSYDRRVISTLRRQEWRSVYTSDGGYANDGAWMKPRNSLSRRWQWKSLIDELRNQQTIPVRMIREAANLYKRMR